MSGETNDRKGKDVGEAVLHATYTNVVNPRTGKQTVKQASVVNRTGKQHEGSNNREEKTTLGGG